MATTKKSPNWSENETATTPPNATVRKEGNMPPPPVNGRPPKKKFASGGKVRGDGCAVRGKTKGRFIK